MRWCAYAILGVALVFGGLANARPIVRTDTTSRVVAPAPTVPSTLRKRDGKPTQHARRDESGAAPATLPATAHVCATTRRWIVALYHVPSGEADARVTAAAARAPPSR